MRGPILYCVEGADNPNIDPRDLILPAETPFAEENRPDLLGGGVTLTAGAETSPPDEAWANRLYRTATPRGGDTDAGRTTFTAIPYHAWANRGPGPMRVWLRTG